MNMQVKDVMKTQVVIARPDANIREAAKIMTDLDIGCLVVLDKDKIVGILSETDVLKKIVAQGADPEKTKVEDIMTKDVVTIDMDKNIEDVAEMMVEKKLKRLPVVNDGKLVGIITATDLISYEPKMIEALSQLFMLKQQQTVAG
ncbi:MAG: CBS domain-containing protein [Candidatus Aenigmarchaeota archaeon]|nr:CBS domain-containing protein [Candidatus Aenigmarchaeota archaeon]